MFFVAAPSSGGARILIWRQLHMTMTGQECAWPPGSTQKVRPRTRTVRATAVRVGAASADSAVTVRRAQKPWGIARPLNDSYDTGITGPGACSGANWQGQGCWTRAGARCLVAKSERYVRYRDRPRDFGAAARAQRYNWTSNLLHSIIRSRRSNGSSAAYLCGSSRGAAS